MPLAAVPSTVWNWTVDGCERSPLRVSVSWTVPGALSEMVALPIVKVGSGGPGASVSVAGAPTTVPAPAESASEKVSLPDTVRVPSRMGTKTVAVDCPAAKVIEPDVAM